MSPDLENLAVSAASALRGQSSSILKATTQYAPMPPASTKPTSLTDQLESIINEMIDVASATLSTQESMFGRLFGYRSIADSAGDQAEPPDFADRINIKLQRLFAILRETQQGAKELSNRL